MKYVFSALALVAITASVSCSPRKELPVEPQVRQEVCKKSVPEPPDPQDARIKLLIRELGLKHGNVLGAMTELAELREEAIPALVEAIRDGDPQRRARALDTFRRMRPAPDPGSAIPAIVSGMTDPDRDVNYQAGRALAHFGPKAKAAVPRLIEMLKDPPADIKDSQTDIDLKWAVIRVLHRIGPDAKAAQGVLRKALDHQDVSLRNASIGALLSVSGSLDGALVPRLMEMLDDDETTYAAGDALRHVEHGKVPLSPVRAFLKDKSPKKRWSALCVLGGMGAAGRKALPDIVRMLADKDPKVRVRACRAIIEIDPPGRVGLDKLLEFINDPKFESRAEAIICWSRVNRKSIDVFPGLVSALEDRRSGVRIQAATSLQYLGPIAQGALVAMEKALRREKDRFVRRALSDAIEYIRGDER